MSRLRLGVIGADSRVRASLLSRSARRPQLDLLSVPNRGWQELPEARLLAQHDDGVLCGHSEDHLVALRQEGAIGMRPNAAARTRTPGGSQS